MNSKKVREIIKFSIQKNIQSKWFIIFNIITLLVMIVSSNMNNIKDYLASKDINIFEENLKIEVIDKEKLAITQLKEIFAEDNFEIVETNENTYTKENIPDDLVLIEVSSSEENYIESKVYSKEMLDGYVYDSIEEVLTQVRSDLFSEKNEIERQELEKLNESVKMEKVMLSIDAENSETKEMIKTVSTLLIYTVSIFIFSKIANEVAQEKVSKSIEYVLTSVTEREYLLAKVTSVIGVTLIQGIYFLIYYFIGNLINNLINISNLEQVNIATNILVSGLDKDIVLYIITVLGYGILTLVLMSIIQAALSSKAQSMDDAGNTIGLLMTITIIAYFVALAVITPYTKMNLLLYVLSCIPLLSNYFIPAILVIGQATPVQIIVSLILLIISIPIAFNKCAVIFKNGVLDYKTVKNKKKKKVKTELSFEEQQKLDLTKKKFKSIGFIIGMALIIYFSSSLIVSLITEILIAPLIIDLVNEEQLGLILMGIQSVIPLILSALFITAYNDKKDKESKVTLKEKLEIVLEGIFLLGILQIGISYLYEYIGIDYNIISTIAVENNSNMITNILLFTILAILPAIFEELLFRKTLINATRKVGIGFAIMASSIIFGLIHMNLGQFIFATLLGVIFAVIYLKTDDLKITMLLHFLNNGYAALQLLITNEKTFDIINIIVIGLMILGGLLFLIRIINLIKSKKLKVKIDKKEIQNYKYLLLDYTFVISIIITALMFVYTENILRIGL